MNVLLDTNILLRLAQPNHVMHGAAVESIEALVQRGCKLRIVPQNLYEFWVVATRSVEANGIGYSSSRTAKEIATLERLFSILDESVRVLTAWRELVVRYDCKGKPAHDAHLVAAMVVNQIKYILTFNDADFARFNEIKSLNPMRVSDWKAALES